MDMTPMQELRKDIMLSDILSKQTKIIVRAFIDNMIEKEKDHLVGMCSIGSRNPGIDPEGIFKTKYLKNKIKK